MVIPNLKIFDQALKMIQQFLNIVREAAKKKILFLPHAVRQMSRPDRMIRTEDIRKILADGEIIEDYPQDVRGHSCLILGADRIGRAIHVVCAPKEDYLAIITAYVPDPHQWHSGVLERGESNEMYLLSRRHEA